MTTTSSDPYTRAVADTKGDRTALYYDVQKLYSDIAGLDYETRTPQAEKLDEALSLARKVHAEAAAVLRALEAAHVRTNSVRIAYDDVSAGISYGVPR